MAKPEFITMARAALNFTKKKSTWEVFLRGYASTNQRGSAGERDILEGLWKNFPTPEALRAACPMDALPRWDRDDPKVGSGLQNLRSRTGAARDLCKVPDLWPKLSGLLRCPDEDSQARVKDFTLKPAEGNANKQIAGMKIGLGTKGADMTMLWGGCEVPVIDLWMLRYLTPQVKELGGQTWGQLVTGYLREMRKEGFDLDLKTPGAPKEFNQIVPAAEIDEYNPAHVQAANGFVQSYIQSTGNLYRIYRDAAYQQAEKEGLPANVWHVATWIELIQSQKYDKDGNEISINRDDYDTWLNNPGDTDVKADKQAVRKSRDFLNTLRLPLPEPYGPSAYRDEEPGTPEWFKEQISLIMRGQTGQSLNTQAALDMLRKLRSKAGAYSDIVELIDQHIDSLERFGARYIPYIQEEEVRQDPALCRPGQCYSNAYLSAMENWDFDGDPVSDDIRIVHGRVRMWQQDKTTDTKYPGYGGHAWVEIEDKVFDPTTGSVIDKERYYELVDPIVDYKLSPLAANYLQVKNEGHYGPYDPMDLVMANVENKWDNEWYQSGGLLDWNPKNEIFVQRPHNTDDDGNFDWVDRRVDLPKMPNWMLNPGDVPFDDEPSRHEMSWQEALMKAQRWAKSHDSKDAKWAEGLIGSMMAGDLGPHLEDLQSLGFSTGREDMIRRQLKLILSHLDEWDGREAMEAVDVLMTTAYPQLNPKHFDDEPSGKTPDAWYDHRSPEIEAQINRGLMHMGTTEVVTDPQTGELISEEEAISRLHFTPRPGPYTYPGDRNWFKGVNTVRGSDEAKAVWEAIFGIKNIFTTIGRENMQTVSGDEFDADARARVLYDEFLDDPGYDYGGVKGIEARKLFPILQKQGLLPDKVQSYVSLSNVKDKLEVVKQRLEQEDDELLNAIMQAEEEMVGLGLTSKHSFTDLSGLSRYASDIQALVG